MEEYSSKLLQREKLLVEREHQSMEITKGKSLDSAQIVQKERFLKDWEADLKIVFEKQKVDREELEKERKQFELILRQHQLDMQENANKLVSMTHTNSNMNENIQKEELKLLTIKSEVEKEQQSLRAEFERMSNTRSELEKEKSDMTKILNQLSQRQLVIQERELKLENSISE